MTKKGSFYQSSVIEKERESIGRTCTNLVVNYKSIVMLIFQSVTIRRAISKNHKALLIGELCQDVSQKYTTAAGEIDVSNWT